MANNSRPAQQMDLPLLTLLPLQCILTTMTVCDTQALQYTAVPKTHTLPDSRTATEQKGRGHAKFYFTI